MEGPSEPVTVKCGNGQLSCFVPLDSSQQDTVTSGVQTVIIVLMAQAKESIK